MHHRRAFTLVELLVVIAVIAILVALLLPAVHSQAAWYGGKLAVDDPIATHCDGSVRFLAENIHPEILIALLTRAGGGLVDLHHLPMV